MQTPISEQMRIGLETAKDSVNESSAALDEAILTDPELSHKQRMVLIHLQTAARRHQLLLEQIAIFLDSIDARCDIIVKHVTSS